MRMRIRKGTMTLLILMIILAIGGCGVNQPNEKDIDTSLQDIKDKGFFVLGMEQEIPPFIYVNRSGSLKGFDLDIMKEVASRMGLEFRVEDIQGKDARLELKEGRVDVLIRNYQSQNNQNENESNEKENDEVLNLSKPYLQSEYVIITRKNSNLSSVGDLKEKKVGINSKSNSQTVMNADKTFKKMNAALNINTFDTNQEVLTALGVGNLDAAVVGEMFARYVILQKPSEFKRIGKLEGEELRSILFRINDKAFKQEIDKILDEMKQDGTLESFSKKWFGYE